MARRKRVLRLAMALSLASVLVLAVGVWIAGTAALTPLPRAVRVAPPDLMVEPMTLRAEGAPDLVGWLAPEQGDLCGVVIILHGRGGARDDMLARARLLTEAGFAVALFDFQGHGESGGDVRGLGYREAEDARRIAEAARAYRPGAPLGVIGVSLGAAAAATAGESLRADAVVLEALYSTLVETTARRMRLPALQELQARILLLQLPLRLGYWASDHRPVDRVAEITAPILFLAGDQDPVATPSQTEALLAAARGDAALVWFPGATHVNLQRYDPALYETSVVPFLRGALCPTAAAAQ